MGYGTLQISDLLAATQPTIIQFGEDRVFDAIDAALAVHNALMADKLDSLVDETTIDRLRRYGGTDQMEMEETDELNRVDAQKVTAGQNIGFPLRNASIALQWTRKYMQTHTPAELAAQFTAAQDADIRYIDRQIRRAFFRPTNYTFVDRLVDNLDIPVKALLNADGSAIPLGPNGEAFDGATHTHYMGVATLDQTGLTSLIRNVTEHYDVGEPQLYINEAQEATIRGFTNAANGDVFQPYYDSRVIVADDITRASGVLDMANLSDRAIGVYGQARVHVKPWVPANYMLVYMMGQVKPLAIRERNPGSNVFALDYENDTFPLRARQLSREMGIGVWTRHAAAVMYIGGASYVQPTL